MGGYQWGKIIRYHARERLPVVNILENVKRIRISFITKDNDEPMHGKISKVMSSQ